MWGLQPPLLRGVIAITLVACVGLAAAQTGRHGVGDTDASAMDETIGSVSSPKRAGAELALSDEQRGRTFVILGTSHYGEPERFGVTRKPFLTPLGEAEVDGALVDELCAGGGDAVRVEDYCHAVEHSVEFQVVFLQHLKLD